ncbi:hypothetical protein [Streptomyces sp. NPDC002088]|uniref:hypothetical protein n=1 Tax=Streptomyces sp. NPDC002088 TaxID=3154665 RepID=UPI0033319068
MLGAFGKHLTVAGEGWIVIRPNADILSPDAPEDGHDWRVLSTREVSQKSGKLTAEIDGKDVEIPPGCPRRCTRGPGTADEVPLTRPEAPTISRLPTGNGLWRRRGRARFWR